MHFVRAYPKFVLRDGGSWYACCTWTFVFLTLGVLAVVGVDSALGRKTSLFLW